MGNLGDGRRSRTPGPMKSNPRRIDRLEPRATDKAFVERPGTGEIVHRVLTRFYRKGRIPGLLDGPELSRIAVGEYHRG
jgi:hypothetical protein